MLLGTLRADITEWWNVNFGSQTMIISSTGDFVRPDSTVCVRLLMNGSELLTESDKKTLQALEFRSEQVLVWWLYFLLY